MPTHTRPSAHDVARLAGVSQAAVSRAFTPGASISSGTREKVLDAANALGYRPNLLARSLIKGESGIVGVVIGSALNAFFASALDLLSVGLSKKQKHILVFTAQDSTSADLQVEELLKYRVDALLIMAAGMSAEMAKRCHSEGIPVVFFNRLPQKIDSVSTVVGNNRSGAKQIAEHLLRQGYKKISLIRGRENSLTGRERESGFISYLSKHGASLHSEAMGDFNREGAIEGTRKLLAAKSRPDAIFCTNDYMALAAIEVARHEFGLEIGTDLGVAGFDDVEQACWPSFDLTTFTCPIEAMIKTALEILLSDKKNLAPRLSTIEGVLRVRGSTTRKSS